MKKRRMRRFFSDSIFDYYCFLFCWRIVALLFAIAYPCQYLWHHLAVSGFGDEVGKREGY